MKRFLFSSILLAMAVLFVTLWIFLLTGYQSIFEYKQWMMVFLFLGCCSATGWLMSILEWHREKCKKENNS
jgi:hypothetical protein